MPEELSHSCEDPPLSSVSCKFPVFLGCLSFEGRGVAYELASKGSCSILLFTKGLRAVVPTRKPCV